MKRILLVVGTRPEGIKMAPVFRELVRHGQEFEPLVCVTAQHREMLDQVLELFEMQPDIDLNLMEHDQGLASLTARALGALTDTLARVRPDLVLVQGDTTTAMVAALAAFYQRVPVGHVEAGLRTRSRYRPFPEEMNRRLLATLATYHFAPTERAAAALREEAIPADSIFVTGNPVIDALHWVCTRPPSAETERFLASVGMGRRSRDDRRTLLVTAHRRESIGTPLAGICHGIRAVVARNPDVQVVCPVHPNPTVRRTLASRLANHARIHLVEALPYETLVHLLARSDLVLTDSGGLQEEGPALGKPVLVLRDETERPEAVETGAAMVVGTDPAAIGLAVERLLRDPEAYRRMASAVSPYGDGRAAERIVCIIRKSFPQDRVSVQERRDESLKARVRPDGGQCGQVLTRVDCCPQPVQDLVPRRV